VTVNTSRFPLKSPNANQKLYSGKFVGINGAAPTSYTLDNGVAVTRSSEGVHVITLPSPMKAFHSVIVQAVDNDGNTHDCNWVLSDSARTITVTHRTAAGTTLGSVAVDATITDVAAADAATTNRGYAAAPIAGTITKIQAQIQSGGPLNAAAVVTCNINGTPITTGAITIPDTTAAGTVTAVTPTAANVVAVGDILTAVTDAGGSTTAAVEVQFTIAPTSLAVEDVIDVISFMAVVDLADI
jgi:hypothetical protein